MQDRVVFVASAVFLAVLCAAVLLVDYRHRGMVMEKAALEARTLRQQLTSRTRVAPVLDRDEVRVVVPTETAASFLEPGRSAYIAANGLVLWRSAGPKSAILLPASAGKGPREGFETVGNSRRRLEVYQSSETVPHRLLRPALDGTADAGDRMPGLVPYRYPVTYHVLLDYAPYRGEIAEFRINMAAVVLAAMLLLFATTRMALHYQLRPLARVTGDVSRLSGQTGETVAQRQDDPEEIRVLADRINEFLVTLDETRRWERDTVRHIHAALETMKETMLAEEVSQGGFMHSLNHMLSDILLMDFRTVSEEDKAELHESVERMRDMLGKRLNALVIARRAGPVPAVDIVPVVQRFRALMNRRFTGRSFIIENAAAHMYVSVPSDDLLEMIGNLLRNAGHWSSQTVLLRTSILDGMAHIAVEDDGPGYPKEGRGLLLAWARGAESGSLGHGIGLPYVNSLARSYGGKLSLADSANLGGAMAVLELPLRPDVQPPPRSVHRTQGEADA